MTMNKVYKVSFCSHSGKLEWIIAREDSEELTHSNEGKIKLNEAYYDIVDMSEFDEHDAISLVRQANIVHDYEWSEAH